MGHCCGFVEVVISCDPFLNTFNNNKEFLVCIIHFLFIIDLWEISHFAPMNLQMLNFMLNVGRELAFKLLHRLCACKEVFRLCYCCKTIGGICIFYRRQTILKGSLGIGVFQSDKSTRIWHDFLHLFNGKSLDRIPMELT